MRVYKNVEQTYSEIKGLLTYDRSSIKSRNKYARSKEKAVDINEIFGYAWEVMDPSDVLDLIAEISKDPVDRIKSLRRKAKEFIGGKPIDPPSDKSYTYATRISAQLNPIIQNIKEHRDVPNRQAFLSIWHPFDSAYLGEKEVPCSIGYHFIPRYDELHMVYFMRSLDIEIWPNDVYLSRHLQEYVAYMCNMKVGRIIFMVSCLHVFL